MAFRLPLGWLFSMPLAPACSQRAQGWVVGCICTEGGFRVCAIPLGRAV